LLADRSASGFPARDEWYLMLFEQPFYELTARGLSCALAALKRNKLCWFVLLCHYRGLDR
jgi:hypothetical protein